MRTLASVQKIESVLPHTNADSLEIARVLGWNVVVKKGEFKAGDLCVYVECDSILPERPEFEFMRSKKFRVKTIKLRGQVSQGICFPLSILPQDCDLYYKSVPYVDDDCTEILGIVKYDPEVAMNHGGPNALHISTFPSFIPKTDEVRVQSMPRLLSDYKGTLCYATEKLDGSSFTAYYTRGKDGDHMGICSRNQEIKPIPENAGNVFYEVAKQYNLFENMHEWYCNIAIQGEVIGPKIQGNRYNLKKPELRLFSILFINDWIYGNLGKLEEVSRALKIPTAPIIKDAFKLPATVDEMVEMSKGVSELNPSVPREGIVVRSWNHIPDPNHKVSKLSFKVINPDYLLKYE